MDTHFSSVPFHAKFAEELNTTSFSEDPGSDGFVINSAPLFEVRGLNQFCNMFSFPLSVLCIEMTTVAPSVDNPSKSVSRDPRILTKFTWITVT